MKKEKEQQPLKLITETQQPENLPAIQGMGSMLKNLSDEDKKQLVEEIQANRQELGNAVGDIFADVMSGKVNGLGDLFKRCMSAVSEIQENSEKQKALNNGKDNG